jgi:hypothetical protein
LKYPRVWASVGLTTAPRRMRSPGSQRYVRKWLHQPCSGLCAWLRKPRLRSPTTGIRQPGLWRWRLLPAAAVSATAGSTVPTTVPTRLWRWLLRRPWSRAWAWSKLPLRRLSRQTNPRRVVAAPVLEAATQLASLWEWQTRLLASSMLAKAAPNKLGAALSFTFKSLVADSVGFYGCSIATCDS